MARFTVFLALLLASIHVGCSSLEKRSTSQFLKPLSSEPNSQLLREKPDERELCIETARSVAAKGHASEAILLYEKAEQLDSKAGALDLELAPLYAQTGQTEKALSRYQSVLAKGVATSEIYNNLAWTLIESKRNAEAELIISQGLNKHPEDERLRSALAIVLYKLGKREESIEVFRELYGPAGSHHNVAVLDLDHGRIDSALAELATATQIPGCPKETFNLRDSLRTELAAANQPSDSMTR
ncbi:tetratricopeptide repeat protein [Roseiconus nitratireducens]|uniref:Tetratricopeptide repeat protein n=1 Tax=Roseiconus nitratireducens TaxID=2605748 RepID=A0A5M6DEB2_9BACT|nr:tetratricopeptide repeat protein [Roseiconus nitratireducens]KAA5545874.1 tetratricopeptide repeat protein [Roseiconus nitratireducens]